MMLLQVELDFIANYLNTVSVVDQITSSSIAFVKYPVYNNQTVYHFDIFPLSDF